MTQAATSTKSVANKNYFDHVMSLLERGKKVKLPVKGNSMYPFLKEGDMVLLQSFRGVPRTGKIVLARYKNAFVLHRIVDGGGKSVFLAGDNNLVLQEQVRHEDLIAEVEEAYRDERSLDICSPGKMLVARVWYRLRLLRRVWGKISRKKHN